MKYFVDVQNSTILVLFDKKKLNMNEILNISGNILEMPELREYGSIMPQINKFIVQRRLSSCFVTIMFRGPPCN